MSEHDEQQAQELLKLAFTICDRLYLEAVNGIVCTPPNTENPWRDEGEPQGCACDVEAPLGRHWCGSCQRTWRMILDLRTRLLALIVFEGSEAS